MPHQRPLPRSLVDGLKYKNSSADPSTANRVIAEKIGWAPETLRKWLLRAEVDSGALAGVTSEERARTKELEREVRELRWANEILRKASA